MNIYVIFFTAFLLFSVWFVKYIQPMKPWRLVLFAVLLILIYGNAYFMGRLNVKIEPDFRGAIIKEMSKLSHAH